MANWIDTIKSIAPTVATALGGPLAGAAVSALGNIFGMSQPTQDSISKMFADGMITPEHLAEIRKLELDYQNQEKERGFRYAELEFKDRDSARQMAIQTHAYTPAILTWVIVVMALGAEIGMLFHVIPQGANEMVTGRILGTLDSALVLVLGFWFGSSHGSQNKDVLLANAAPPR